MLIATGLVIMYGINSFATLMMNSKSSRQRPLSPKDATGKLLTCFAGEEFKNDPRNPNAKAAKPADKH